MKKDIIEYQIVGGGLMENWKPTMKLRWCKSYIQVQLTAFKEMNVLQQLWKSDSGKTEWREIEIVNL